MRLPALIIVGTLMISLNSPAALADQTDSRLDPLFSRLLASRDLATIRATENAIWTIWYEHANPDVERLMQLGIQRMNADRIPEAMLIFTQLVENFPDYAEGWNKRATLHYLIGNLEDSIADINRTLALEPRHFGALSGLGLVYIQREELDKAKQAFEELIDIHPNSPNARRNLELVNENLRFGII